MFTAVRNIILAIYDSYLDCLSSRDGMATAHPNDSTQLIELNRRVHVITIDPLGGNMQHHYFGTIHHEDWLVLTLDNHGILRMILKAEIKEVIDHTRDFRGNPIQQPPAAVLANMVYYRIIM
ncbi:hypothetical protein FRC11_007935 [Ceratobasidium sp. 423]|nr:hypothetical protein FRC11_007935 [Ceratobasidium sp. 423]